MSTVRTDGTYRNANTAEFTNGTLRLILDQTTPLLPAEAKQAGVQADKVMGHLVCTAFQVGSLISDYIEKYQVRQGSSSTEAANWQEVGKLHLRARLAITVNFAVPEFILAEAADRALQDFRRILTIEMDPSFMAEEEARKPAARSGGLFDNPSDALAFLDAMVGKDSFLGADGVAGMMVGKPFGGFAGGNGFAG